MFICHTRHIYIPDKKPYRILTKTYSMCVIISLMLSIIKTYLFISDLTYSVCKIKVKQKQKKKKKPTKINIVFTYKLHKKYIYTYIRYTILYIHIYLLRLSMYELLNAHWRCKNSTQTHTHLCKMLYLHI